MYIKHIHDENIGPIKKVDISFPFNEDNTPKPVIIVGENGSGKSTLLSNIVDAFYLLADKEYINAMANSDYGTAKEYYKAISPIEIHSGSNYMISYIQFGLKNQIKYVFKSGKLSFEQAKKAIGIKTDFPFPWSENDNLKNIIASKEDTKEAFEKGIICFFGADRYEKPIWQGEKYSSFSQSSHKVDSKNQVGELINPITVNNANLTNKQWVMDVIIDSRVDLNIEKDSKSVFNTNTLDNMIKLANSLFVSQMKTNLDQILSNIVNRDVYLSLNNRKTMQSRLSIIEKETNAIIAPSLDSLSTGQLTLFNVFSTILHYADNYASGISVNMNDISGIVVIDEVELHLHTQLQKEVLPRLIKLFPKVQFVITTHSPLFLLGMQEEFGDDGFEIYNMPDAERIDVERFSEFQRAYEYFKNTATYQKETEEKLKKAISEIIQREETEALVITEGATDWKHIKTAYSVLSKLEENKELFDHLKFEFLEYVPVATGVDDELVIEMGNSSLCNLCESYAKIPNNKKYIFIADRDHDNTNKKLSIEGQKYKNWGNNVFSFILPLPEHRAETPNICIEHLYKDEEIRTEVDCNGTKRRLFLGNEFDSRGMAFEIERFCEKKNKCGQGKYSIIDGSSGERVTSLDNKEEINYALPKMDFANYVAQHPDEFNFDSFLEIFRILNEILSEGANKCLTKHQQ